MMEYWRLSAPQTAHLRLIGYNIVISLSSYGSLQGAPMGRLCENKDEGAGRFALGAGAGVADAVRSMEKKRGKRRRLLHIAHERREDGVCRFSEVAFPKRNPFAQHKAGTTPQITGPLFSGEGQRLGGTKEMRVSRQRSRQIMACSPICWLEITRARADNGLLVRNISLAC